jgi:hypothetical protein
MSANIFAVASALPAAAALTVVVARRFAARGKGPPISRSHMASVVIDGRKWQIAMNDEGVRRLGELIAEVSTEEDDAAD